MSYNDFIETKRQTVNEMKFTNLVPNENVIQNIAALLPSDVLEKFKNEGGSKFEFGLFIVRFTVQLEICELPEAFDLVFGDGTYEQFKEEVYNVLKNS